MTGLSKSTLQQFQRCPRCFWLSKVKKIDQPRGIFPSIVKGLDKMMKRHVESCVATARDCKWLSGIEGAAPFPDRTRLAVFRNWRTFKRTVTVDGDEITLWGELDDLLSFPSDGTVAPWDFKSNGEARDDSYFEKYNQLDADVYDFILQGHGLKTSGYAYFTSMWPSESYDDAVHFQHRTIRIKSNPNNALALAGQALACLAGSLPASGYDCEFCKYVMLLP